MLIVHRDLLQGTEEWHEVRRGVLTASVVGKLITPTLKVASNEGSRTLAFTLAAERITRHIDDGFHGSDMARGQWDEPHARDAYAALHGPVDEVGFIVREADGLRIGCSPDGLVGDVGMVEIKSRLQRLQLRTILDDVVPAEYMAQIQAELYVTGRAWCDFVSYCGGMPLYVKRVYPDGLWQRAIETAWQALEADVALAISRYRSAVDGLPLTERIPYDLDIQIGA